LHVVSADPGTVWRTPLVSEPVVMPGALGLPAKQVVQLEMAASSNGISAGQAAGGSAVESLRAGPIHHEGFASGGEAGGVTPLFRLVLYGAKLSRPPFGDLASGGLWIGFWAVREADDIESQPGLAERLAGRGFLFLLLRGFEITLRVGAEFFSQSMADFTAVGK